jgi:hypothetical protein
VPRLSIPFDPAVAMAESAKRQIHWAEAYMQFPTQMGMLIGSRPKYGGPFLDLFQSIMWDPAAPLTRQEREMIAMVVSRASRCRY